jgi:hypothetical protein
MVNGTELTAILPVIGDVMSDDEPSPDLPTYRYISLYPMSVYFANVRAARDRVGASRRHLKDRQSRTD